MEVSVDFIDVEHALDPAYATKIGVDVNNLYISQPDTGETGTGNYRSADSLWGNGCGGG